MDMDMDVVLDLFGFGTWRMHRCLEGSKACSVSLWSGSVGDASTCPAALDGSWMQETDGRDDIDVCIVIDCADNGVTNSESTVST